MVDKSKWIEAVIQDEVVSTYVTAPAPWAGHIPFATWFVQTIKPRVYVELGAYSGVSYFSIGEALYRSGSTCEMHAVDTWAGDEHAGFYGKEIFEKFVEKNLKFEAFSTAHRKTFDEAAQDPKLNNIDLLHIDGLHTYDAVKHDFYTWKDKLTDDAIVMFHDTNVDHPDFGVNKLFAELIKSETYQGFSFDHSNGLGVLFVSEASVQRLAHSGFDFSNKADLGNAKSLFSKTGRQLEILSENMELRNEISDFTQQLANHESLITSLSQVEVLRDRLSDEIEAMSERQAAGEQQISKLSKNNQFLETEMQRQSLLIEELLKDQSFTILLKVSAIRLEGGAVRLFRKCWEFVSLVLARLSNASRYVLRGDFAGLARRFKYFFFKPKELEPLGEVRTIGILSVPHTLTLADTLAHSLSNAEFKTFVIAEFNDQAADLWFVLGAQAHKSLPREDRRILIQLEQTSTSRWFTRRYISALQNSVAVIDFSGLNLPALAQYGLYYPHLFLVELGACPNLRSKPEKKIDVLFYGDASCAHRKKYLKRLSEEFNVRVESDLFGAPMQDLIAAAKVVVNIHYYSDACLETTRIYECLSLGTPVVSESTRDCDHYSDLIGAVTFAPAGDVDAMVDAVRHLLDQEPSKKIDDLIATSVGKSFERFQKGIFRTLLGVGVRGDKVWPHLLPDMASNNPIVISLPETHERRERALTYFPKDFEFWSGLRAPSGWRGCGLSYKAISSSAKKHTNVWVFEDDAVLPDQPKEFLEKVNRFLDLQAGNWDVFCGLISRLSDEVRIIDVKDYEGVRFVFLDQMMSMVANAYSPRALELLSDWDPLAGSEETNTIDVYLNAQGVKTVTTIPMFFDHYEDQVSSIWGFKNIEYTPYIKASQELLEKKVLEYLDADVSATK